MLGLFKRKPVNYFSEEEKQLVTHAIEKAEHQTSGEVRVFIESHCKPANPVLRAKEVFQQLKMFATAERNGVLVYVAMKDKKLAVYGDEGIHTKVGDAFWETEVAKMLQHFNKTNYAEGIAGIIHEIGVALATHFPYDEKGDTNELPDDIVFGN
jgi:uncharacterized membrane protein